MRILVPFPAGGPTDVMARLIGQSFRRLGQQFVIENSAAPAAISAWATRARGRRRLHDPVRVIELRGQSEPLSQGPVRPREGLRADHQGGRGAEALSRSRRSGAQRAGAGRAHQSRSGEIQIASPGIGTTPHLSIELFKQAFWVGDLTVVPFFGGNPSIQSVVAGHTPLSFQAIPPATALIKEGKLRALAVTSTRRSSVLPDVPTLDELGIKGQEAETMQGVLAPAGTPQSRSSTCCSGRSPQFSRLPDVKEKVLALGFEPSGITPAEFGAYITAEIAKWRRVIEDSKMDKI